MNRETIMVYQGWKQELGGGVREDLDLGKMLGRLSNKTELFRTQAPSIQLTNPSSTFPLAEMSLLKGRGKHPPFQLILGHATLFSRSRLVLDT